MVVHNNRTSRKSGTSPAVALGLLIFVSLSILVSCNGCALTTGRLDVDPATPETEASVPEAQVSPDYPVQLHVEKVVICDKVEKKGSGKGDLVEFSVLIEGFLEARAGFDVVGMVDHLLPINTKVGRWSMGNYSAIANAVTMRVYGQSR